MILFGERRLWGAVLWAGVIVCLLGQVVLGDVFGDIAITAEPMDQFDQTTHGYVEYRFKVENLSAQDQHEVTLVLPDETFGRNYSLRQIKRSAVVGPQSTVTMSLWQPPIDLSYGAMKVVIDGRDFTMDVSRVNHTMEYYSYRRYGGGPLSSVLTSRGVKNDCQDLADKAMPAAVSSGSSSSYYGSSSGRRQDYEIRRSETEISQWSENWLGYSRYDGIILNAEEMRTMPSDVRLALEKYMECGGSLLVAGNWTAPANWQEQRVFKGNHTVYYRGYGECIVIGEGDVEKWSSDLWQNLKRTWKRSQQPWQTMRTVTSANNDFPVVEDLEVPVRALFFIILVFSITIGPLNLWFFSNRGHRMRLLWTVPLLSLLTSAGVFGYAIYSEGLNGHMRTEDLTILDEVGHRAVTVGWQGFYSPLTPRGGLTYEMDSELTPQIFNSRDGSGRSIDLSRGQNLEMGWISARVPSHFMIRKNQTRRERLTVSHDTNGKLSVRNDLGAPIAQLFLADEEGRIFQGGDMAAGAISVLAPRSGQTDPNGIANGRIGQLRDVYTTDWIMQFKRFDSEPERYLRPNCYIAILDESLFIENGLGRNEQVQSREIVYGIR
ncbi:MAG: hypothetical protein GY869_27700 [Planctomycetes bacterium]|nr:hypothetical protein [Planctomycetota bacterium]